MSWLEKFNWKPLTPGKLPAGARISAGKSGSVEMSLPTIAEVLVNCVPVSCMPSPESPAKRMVTVSNCSSCLSTVTVGGSKTALMDFDDVLLIRISDCPLPIADLEMNQSEIGNRKSAMFSSAVNCIHHLCREWWQIHRGFGITLRQISDD